MEILNKSHICPHGVPTYVTLSKNLRRRYSNTSRPELCCKARTALTWPEWPPQQLQTRQKRAAREETQLETKASRQSNDKQQDNFKKSERHLTRKTDNQRGCFSN